jgi:hypothetical protein
VSTTFYVHSSLLPRALPSLLNKRMLGSSHFPPISGRRRPGSPCGASSFCKKNRLGRFLLNHDKVVE